MGKGRLSGLMEFGWEGQYDRMNFGLMREWWKVRQWANFRPSVDANSEIRVSTSETDRVSW